jgi:hypothetical protein
VNTPLIESPGGDAAFRSDDERESRTEDSIDLQSRPCLDDIKIPSFFILSITSIFSRLHGVLNVGKK